MKNVTRRIFLQRLVVVGVAGQAVLGCSDQNSSEPVVTTVDSLSAKPTKGGQDTFSCTDITDLTEAEVMTRTTFQYVDLSTESGRNCRNCALYVVPETGDGCGRCLTIRGPVHPEGYCTIWAARTG